MESYSGIERVASKKMAKKDKKATKVKQSSKQKKARKSAGQYIDEAFGFTKIDRTTRATAIKRLAKMLLKESAKKS